LSDMATSRSTKPMDATGPSRNLAPHLIVAAFSDADPPLLSFRVGSLTHARHLYDAAS
jgi:hypothetical protein